MPDYRIFSLDIQDRIIGVERVDCSTDDDALAKAAEKVSCRRGAEVWRLTRFVGKLAAARQTRAVLNVVAAFGVMVGIASAGMAQSRPDLPPVPAMAPPLASHSDPTLPVPTNPPEQIAPAARAANSAAARALTEGWVARASMPAVLLPGNHRLTHPYPGRAALARSSAF